MLIQKKFTRFRNCFFLSLGNVAQSQRAFDRNLINALQQVTRYIVGFVAFNKIGVGTLYEVITTSTLGTVPQPPAKNQLLRESPTSITLQLDQRCVRDR